MTFHPAQTVVCIRDCICVVYRDRPIHAGYVGTIYEVTERGLRLDGRGGIYPAECFEAKATPNPQSP